MHSYETIFILKSGLGEESVKGHTGKIKDMITGDGGSLLSVEDWGEKKLAYPIKKQKYGHYFLIVFKSNPEFISRLEKNYLLNEDIIRHSILLYEGPEIELAKDDEIEEEVDKTLESTTEENK